MLNIIKENNKYFNAVTQSIVALHKTESEIENERGLFTTFTDFLTKNAGEISKFHAIETEIVEFLQTFSFTGKIDFTPVHDKLLPLSSIRQKLIEMGNEAKKLVGLPDRYNCHKAIEVCKQLTLFCVNKMRSTDYEKVTTALDRNIPKLLSIQKEFEKEHRILSDINNVLQQHAAVLNKFPAYNTELQQFVHSFPNNRDTDLETVESRLAVLNDILAQTDDIIKTLAQINQYADRYSKNAIFQQTKSLVSSAYSQLRISNTSRVKVELQRAMSNIKLIINAFDKERKDTIALRNKLKKNSPNLWQEDNERLIAELAGIIKTGTETSNFVLQSFYDRERTAANKKSQDIANVERDYPWIKRKRYGWDHHHLRTEYMPFSRFQSEIKNIRKRRSLLTKLFELIFYQ
jgi:hypothetical protein